MIAYDLHPEVRRDRDEIWRFIREYSLDAADKVTEDILSRISEIKATNAQT
jgi:hypothetical protein